MRKAKNNTPVKYSGRQAGSKQRLRIIGGQWRRRSLSFISSVGLRPTPERTRETLFNWLQGQIMGARCLDLFAGSGALGFEAASRGAAEVVFVEKNAQVVAQLEKMRHTLQGNEGVNSGEHAKSASKITIVRGDALRFLTRVNQSFDFIFLDPPFRKALLDNSLKLIEEHKVLNINGLIYVEGESHLDSRELFRNWTVIKKTQAGDSTAYLCQLN